MGRRTSSANLLKGWDFFGKDRRDQWILLSSFSNKQFAQNEVRTYNISSNEAFSAFLIKMTEPESSGYWTFCMGQIEVFGDI